MSGALLNNVNNSFRRAAEAVGLNKPTAEIVPGDDAASTTPSEASDALEELSELCPKLTYQQRVVGFASAFGIGYLITFFSFGFFIRLVEGNPRPFVLSYLLGNICSIMAATFLCGPSRQFKRMFHDTRKWTTVAYLSTMVVTMTMCFVPHVNHVLRLIILVLLLCVQFCASLWYSLSYLPFARRTVLNCLKEWA